MTSHRHRWDTFDASWCPEHGYRCIGGHDGAWVVRVRECKCGAFQRYEETSGTWEVVPQ
jgi:hypothetical protein